MRRVALLALCAAAAVAASAGDDDASRRGPFEWRERWLLAQPRLTLAPVSPDPLGPGILQVRVDLDWGNDLGWSQPVAGESREGRRFLVDGEHRSVSIDLRRGITTSLDLGLRLPIEWRGGGTLDGVINWFHGFTSRLGLPDNGRPSFSRGLLRVDGIDVTGAPLVWDTRSGTGLGAIEMSARWAFAAREPDRTGRAALVASLALPTGTGPFDGGRPAIGLELVGARTLGRSADVFAGIGGTFGDASRRGSVGYEAARPYGFVAVERRFGRRWSAIGQSSAAGRLVENVARYPGLQWYLALGARLNLDSGYGLEGGFTENIANQQATTDFGVQVGVTRRFGRR